MRLFLSVLFLIFITIFSSCSTDFEVNEKWKEIDIVYGLLDKKDSVQYIRINKAFLNDNRSALEVAKETDSIYHDTLVVRLQKIINGQVKDDKRLEKIYTETLEPGIFAAPGQFLYKTPGFPYVLDPGATYKLLVENPRTGVKVDATTKIVGDATIPINSPINLNHTISFVPGEPSNVSWKTGANARFYDFTFHIYYLETNSINGKTDTVKLIWPVSRFNLTPGLEGGRDMVQLLKGDNFFSFMAQQVPIKQNIRRKLSSVDIILEGGGQDVYYYISVNKPATGIVQKKPEFTNINNGYGIFSSRTKQVFTVKPDADLRNNILTKDLNFD